MLFKVYIVFDIEFCINKLTTLHKLTSITDIYGDYFVITISLIIISGKYFLKNCAIFIKLIYHELVFRLISISHHFQ